jgi:integrase
MRSPHVNDRLPSAIRAGLAVSARREGGVLVRERKLSRVYALRFRAYGERQYLTLGHEHEGWDLAKAEVELQNVLADVRRGLWVLPKKKRRGAREWAESGEAQPFGPFAVELTKSRAGQVAEKTTKHERWALGHLVPFFGDWALSEIDVEGVDEYRAFTVEEAEARARAIERGKPKRNEHGQILRPLSARSINRTIDHLQWVLSIALEYKRFGVAENAAEGKRRRLRESRPAPAYIDSAAQIEALLEAAAELDRDPRYELAEREAIVGTFVLGGPRATELGHMLWRDIDLAGSRIFIGCSKTAAGLREIEILPILRDILAVHRAIAYRGDPDALVFPTLTGARRDADSLRTRVLAAVFERADELLGQRGLVPLPKGLTTHKLRHAFASVLIALGEDPISVMRQIGHADPTFTLRVYTHMMIRDPAERQRLKALVRGERVIARSAPPPESLDLAAYELPILAALAERDGRASRGEVLAAVGEAMADRHAERDLEALPSGPPRWQPRIGKVRARLVGRGWLAVSGRGPGCEWELTELGWVKVRREKKIESVPQVLP